MSDWLLKVAAPFWSESFLYVGRAVDLAGIGYALHQATAPARVGLRCCGLCCRRQVGRNDLLRLAEPALAADSGAALFDVDKATVSAPAVAVDSTPFVGIGRGRADREQDYYNDRRHQFHYRPRGEGQVIVLNQPSPMEGFTDLADACVGS